MEVTKSLDELKAEARGLGITFNVNIGAETLHGKIETFYESQSAGDLVKEKDVVDPEVDPEPSNVAYDVPGSKAVLSKEQKTRNMVAKAKAKAMRKRVVTITSNDKRDNDVTTTTYLGFENQYFGISKLVPLDVPLELELCLIDVAKTTFITLHKDEIIDGKRTGNKVPVPVRKLNVSFEDMQA